MNKSEVDIETGVLGRRFDVDKSDCGKALVFTGSWNAYCLAQSSDRFVL
jgi:hypothetical protein